MTYKWRLNCFLPLTWKSKVRVLSWWSALHKDTPAGCGGDWTLLSLLCYLLLSPAQGRSSSSRLRVILVALGPRWRSSLRDQSGWALLPVRKHPRDSNWQLSNRPTGQLVWPPAHCYLFTAANRYRRSWWGKSSSERFFVVGFTPLALGNSCSGGLRSRDSTTWRDFQMSRRRRNNLHLTK